MNNTCLSLQQDSAAMQTAAEIRQVVHAAKTPSVNSRGYSDDDNGTGLVSSDVKLLDAVMAHDGSSHSR